MPQPDAGAADRDRRAATKVDLKRELDAYRARRGEFRILDVPAQSYLAIDGSGDPNTSPDFAAAVETLYPVSYRLKFASRRELGRDYVVMPLEGLWWAADWSTFTTARDKTRWDWTLMILVPDWIPAGLVETVVRQLRSSAPPPRLDDVRLEQITEGRCVQTLHVGSYDDEGPVLGAMHDDFIPAHGLALRGRHHEIYLSDARRVVPEKRRTILRQPVTTSG